MVDVLPIRARSLGALVLALFWFVPAAVHAGAGVGGTEVPFTVVLVHAAPRDFDDSPEGWVTLIGSGSLAVKRIEVPASLLPSAAARLSIFGTSVDCWYPDDHQTVRLTANGVEVATFDSCTWSKGWHDFTVPAALLRAGWNEFRLEQTTGPWSWWSVKLGYDAGNAHGNSLGRDANYCPTSPYPSGCDGLGSTGLEALSGELLWKLDLVGPPAVVPA